MQSIQDLLKNRDIQQPASNRVTQEFQSYGLYLAEKLHDKKHTAIYIKLAKTRARQDLQQALSFVSDANARNMGALFMWKLKELRSKE